MNAAAEQNLNPEDMLTLMREQRRSTRARLERRFTMLLLVWAVAWAIGFGALWSAEDVGGNPWLRIPDQIAWPIFCILLATGAVWSIVTGILAGRGFRGSSRLAGELYGWSWSVSMVGGWLFIMGLERAGLTNDIAALLYPGLFISLVGVLYLTGGALERSPAMFALGCVMIATVATATMVGAPTHYLLYATVGPAAMIVLAIAQVRGTLSTRAEAV